MARMRDVIPAFRSAGFFRFCKRVWQQINEDGIFIWASALSYSWIFAVFPFLIFMLTLVPYLPEQLRNHAYHGVTEAVQTMLGKAAPTINDNVRSVLRQRRHGWLGFGLVLGLWAASGGMTMTMSALDRCYDIKNGRPYWRQRLIAMLLTLALTLCTLVLFIVLPVGSMIQDWLWYHHDLQWSPILYTGVSVARYAVAIFFSLLVLSILYHFGPCIKHRFHFFSPGAVFAMIVWIILEMAFRTFIDRYARYDQTYGAVGGVVILLMFFYIDAMVLLVGAEINSEIDFEILGVPQGCKDFTGKKPDPEITPEL